VEKVPVLVALGVTAEGHKLVVGLQAGDKESASAWREFLKDLKGRRVEGNAITLGIMDGLTGLERVFKEEFPKARSSAARCMWPGMSWSKCPTS
jgi:putative transposase